MTFESFPGLELALTSLDPRRGQNRPELRSVKEEQGVQFATVFVPDGGIGTFLAKFERYRETSSDPSPKNRNLVERTANIAVATLRSLWTDDPQEFPVTGHCVWWEVWLRRQDGQETDRFAVIAETTGCTVAPTRLSFADRTVLLVQATPEQLAGATDLLDDLAELRRHREPATLLSLDDATEQAEWVQELSERIAPATADAPAVCVLDTGVHQPHPLLSASLSTEDQHTVNPAWGTDDVAGHGTEMAGLALFGDLGAALVSRGTIKPSHRLESVKLLPGHRTGALPHLWGAVTAAAASLVEIQAPERRRAFSMAVTEQSGPGSGSLPGRPTSWSAAVDALAAGRAIDVQDQGVVYLDEETEAQPRLFLISAGNIRSFDDDHLARSDLEPIENPAQAWNALTVGAHTELIDLSSQPSFTGWMPLAPNGELSPYSRTSTLFPSAWPVKPDVVMEGGNVARSPSGTTYDTPELLQVLTTRRPQIGLPRLLTVTSATSAATAQAGYLAGAIASAYPALWPESVRALVIHSARWTPRMLTHFDRATEDQGRPATTLRNGCP